MMSVYFAIILLAGVVGADYTFTVQLQSFSNSSLQRLTNGDCCVCCKDSTTSTCPSPCNSTILVCIRDANQPFNDSSCQEEIVEPWPASDVPMKLAGTFEGLWKGATQISLDVFHYDASLVGDDTVSISSVAASTRIDTIIISQFPLLSSAPPTPITKFNGLFGTIVLNATFQVACAPNFFGADCSMSCENRNDSLGHFTCEPVNGTRECLEGYMNVGTNCTDCELRPGCSPTGGFCNEPGQCICLDGFSGDNCLPTSASEGLPSVPTLSTMLPTQTPTVRTTSDAGLNTTENNTNYIIIGVVSGAVVIMFLITMGFALVLVRTHRRHNRRERNKHEQRNERRFTDVVESSTKYNSNATLNKTTDDPYLGVVVIPGQNEENITANGGEVVFPQPTCVTFQQSDSRILTQTFDDEVTYATPVKTVSEPDTPTSEEHKYYVLESNTDLSSEEYQQLEDATVGNDLLASILVETLTKGPATDELDAGLDAYTQVDSTLQNGRERDRSDFSFIYSDLDRSENPSPTSTHL